MAERAERPKPRGKTGPRSAAGKAASSRNALAHGCTSEKLILPNESKADWEKLLQDWLDDYEPDSPTFTDLVVKAAEAAWFHRRVLKSYNEAEQRLYKQQEDRFVWTEEQHKLLERFLRYRTTAERSFYRARNAAEQMRKTRFREEAKLRELALKEEDAAAAEEDEEEEEQAPKPPVRSEIGQHVTVWVKDGQTVTYSNKLNSTLVDVMRERREQGRLPLIYRTLQFVCQEIPPEYEWTKPLMEKAGLIFKPDSIIEFDPYGEEEYCEIVERESKLEVWHILP